MSKKYLFGLLVSLTFAKYAVFASSDNGYITVRVTKDDTTPPGAVTDLIAQPRFITGEWAGDDGSGKLELIWTAPSDDDYDVSSGKVTSYIIKYATFSIDNLGGDTTAWWQHPAVQQLTSLEVPPRWGILATKLPQEQEVIYITGLTPGEFYWFGIKAVDECYNKSDIDTKAASVIEQAYTYSTTSSEPPAAITTLSAAPNLELTGSVILDWKSPGNNGWDEKIIEGKYRIAYSTYLPFDPGWDIIYISTQDVSPQQDQIATITGLFINTTYYFYIWTKDEWPDNYSDISNVASCIPNFIPPAPITNLELEVFADASPSTGTYVRLTWTNPSNVDFDGVEIYYSTVAFGVNTSTIVISGLTPSTTTMFYHIRLIPRKDYYYGFKAFTKAKLFSTEVQDSIFTSLDALAPDPVQEVSTFVSYTSTEGMTIELSWLYPSTTIYQNIDLKGTKIYGSTTYIYPTETLNEFVITLDYPTNYYRLTDLISYTTYYFAFLTFDEHTPPNYSVPVYISTFTYKDIIPPRPITDLIIMTTSFVDHVDIGCVYELSWTDPSDEDLTDVKIFYRADKMGETISTGEIVIPAKPSKQRSYIINQLFGNVTYYFGVYVFDRAGNYSSATVSGFVYIDDDVAPFEPLGLSSEKLDEGKYKLAWCDVNMNEDFSKFKTTYTATENFRYLVYESSGIYGTWKLLKELTRDELYTIVLSTALSYYKVRAIDVAGNYSDSLIFDTSKDLHIILAIKDAYYAMSKAINKVLSKPDIFVKMKRLKNEEGGSILKSVCIDMYEVVNYKPKSLAIMKFDKTCAKLHISMKKFKEANIFWFNGLEWFVLPTKFKSGYYITETRFTGKYQVRISEMPKKFTFIKVFPKIITPNGDGFNDIAFFYYFNPKSSRVTLKIFDLSGLLVKDLGENYQTSNITMWTHSWDGKDENGSVVPPGVYIYQLEVEEDVKDKIITGTIVVAR